MRVSVILSTYNQPQWLENVIWGYSRQTHRDFEIVVADDGSTPKTAQMLAELRRETGMPIRHVWHGDEGFRKCVILNKATVAASTSYLIFSDGDCIPSEDFVRRHVRFAERGRFLSGGLVRLPMQLSSEITKHDVLAGRATDAWWLLAHGLGISRRLFRLACGPGLGALLDVVTTTRASWNGHNSSGWKSDIISVNGFNEDMAYGGEDRELGERLINSGLRPRQIRHRTDCVHLDHSRGYVTPEMVQRNMVIRRRTRRLRLTWTPNGIAKPADIGRVPPGRLRQDKKSA